jgi:hypothetical protein
MHLRAMLFGFALATSDAVRKLFSTDPPKAVVHVLDDVQCPPYFYVKIDERVFAVKL